MKRLFAAILLIATSSAKAQDSFPVKDGKVVFEQVDSFQGVSKQILLKKSNVWFVNTFRSAKAVLQLADTADGQMLGKGNFDYQFVPIFPPGATWTCEFTIQVDCRDGKARIRLYDMSAYCKGEATAEYFQQHHQKNQIRPINERVNGILASFQKALSQPGDNF